MKLNGAQIICRLLERQGIHTLSGIPGGANLPLYDALHESRIAHILARHEQGGAFIAHGMARVTGRAAVCLGTSGPGATNLLTAIADAKLDSVPLVAITGQVPTALLGTDAFQEVDTYGLTLPITKHNFLVMRTEELLEIVPRAFEIAQSGRPGPVVIDIPKDVLLGEMEISESDWPEPGQAIPAEPCTPEEIARLAAMITKAERPILYIGGGVIASEAGPLVLELAERIGAPLASTLMGLGAIPAKHPLSLGMLGMHGARSTNMLLEEADLLVAIGVRFDDRATGKATEFCKHATIAHIDIDPSEIGKIKPANLAIVGDARQVLCDLLQSLPTRECTIWRERVQDLKKQYPLTLESRGENFHPLDFCKMLGKLLPKDAILTTDVGQHQMWMAQGYPFSEPRTWLTSGGLGTMGFGLPAAIGAAIAAPGRRVVCVTGDGSILMNIQELVTLAELNLDVTTIILNNAHLGMVRQQQELFYNGRYSASRFAMQPDFAAAARAFGIPAFDLNGSSEPGELVAKLSEAVSKPGPVLVNLTIHQHENVFPMVPPGAANREMIEANGAME